MDNHVLLAPLAFNLLLGRPWPPTEHDLQTAGALCEELELGPLHPGAHLPGVRGISSRARVAWWNHGGAMILKGPASTGYRWEPITIAEQLERTARDHADAPAIVFGDRRMSWREVRDEARAVARGLLQRGIGRGDHIALWVPNRPEWVIAWLAAAYAGGVVVPVNTRYKADEVRYILRQSDARLLVVVEGFLDIDYGDMLDDLCPRSEAGRDTSDFPELQEIFTVGTPLPGTTAFDDLAGAGAAPADADLDAHAATVTWESPTIIVYTSGTTGHPKGAVLSHGILRNECSLCEWLQVDADSRVLGHMPMFHVAGCINGVLPCLITGACLVLMDHWDTDEALVLIAGERISLLGGVPTHFIDLIGHPDLSRFDTSSLKVGWIGGATVPREVVEGALGRLGMKALLPVYGLTETTGSVTFPRVDDPEEIILSGRGVPMSDFEVRVVDTEGNELDPGAEGEICVRGHSVMQGYYRKPEETAAVFDADGWLHTGDLGVLDEDGYLGVTGRISDMFIVGGANAYPAEIEAVLAGHPAVRQAYVVGMPDPRLGEVGCAFVERAPDAAVDEEEIVQFCQAKLAGFKVPRSVRFVEEWPLTATGKIQRFRLREMAGGEMTTRRT